MKCFFSKTMLLLSVMTMTGCSSSFLNPPEPPSGSELAELQNRTYAISKDEIYKHVVTALHKSDFHITGSDSNAGLIMGETLMKEDWWTTLGNNKVRTSQYKATVHVFEHNGQVQVRLTLLYKELFSTEDGKSHSRETPPDSSKRYQRFFSELDALIQQ